MEEEIEEFAQSPESIEAVTPISTQRDEPEFEDFGEEPEKETFHSKSVNGIRQEFYAAAIMTTISRIAINCIDLMDDYKKIVSDSSFLGRIILTIE